MVEQTKDSTLTDYGLACAESGLLNSDKMLSVSIAAKQSALQESQNENSMTVSKSIENPLLVEESRHAGEVVETSGTKRPSAECLQSPRKSNAGGGHIVYVRRKPETESAKSHARETPRDAVDCAQLRESTEQAEATLRNAEMNEPVTCITDVSPPQRASFPSSLSTRRSASPSLRTSGNISSPGNANRVHVDCENVSSDDPLTANIKIWEERYHHLLSLLRMLDQSDQADYVKMLRSLSPVELSQHAAELEKRSMKLALEEGRELQRIGLFDVLGKYPKNVGTTTSTQQNQQIHNK